jgi:hypothetical protein
MGKRTGGKARSRREGEASSNEAPCGDMIDSAVVYSTLMRVCDRNSPECRRTSMPRVGGRKLARLRPLSSNGQRVQPADPDKSMWRGHGLMRSGIQPDRGRGDEGVEPVAGRRTGGVSKARNTLGLSNSSASSLIIDQPRGGRIWLLPHLRSQETRSPPFLSTHFPTTMD